MFSAALFVDDMAMELSSSRLTRSARSQVIGRRDAWPPAAAFLTSPTTATNNSNNSRKKGGGGNCAGSGSSSWQSSSGSPGNTKGEGET